MTEISTAMPADQPPPVALAIAFDLVTRHRLRLVDHRDGRLGSLAGGYELSAASWTGPRAAFVGIYRPPADLDRGAGDLAERVKAAQRWGQERLVAQGAQNCDILLVALGPVSPPRERPPDGPVRVGVIALDMASGSATTLLPPSRGLPDARRFRRIAREVRAGRPVPTLAAVDLAERQVIEGSYNAPRVRTVTGRPVATMTLIGAFVAIFLAEVALIRQNPVDQLQPRPDLVDFGAIVSAGASTDTEWWRYVSSAFLHINSGSFIFHVAINSFAMWNVGRLVEQLYGRLVLLGTFFITAIVGNITWVLATQAGLSGGGISLGASGGISGLIGLLVMLGRVQGRQFPAPIAASIRQSALTSIGLTVFLGFAVAGVNNFAHIGGFISGVLLALALPPVGALGGRHLRSYEKAALGTVIAGGCVALVFAAVHLIGVILNPAA